MLPLGLHLRDRLAGQPDRTVATYVALDGQARPLSARELSARAQAVNAALRHLGLGDRSLVAIVHRSGPWLHAAWLGTLWAGHVPTVIAPPSPRMEPRKYAEGFAGMVGHLGLDAVILDDGTQAALGGLMPAGTPWLATDSLQPTDEAVPIDERAGLDDEVAVQHTSGTTGLQKAVGFTSRQLHVHAGALLQRLEATPQDVVVSWLPLYHDMGFIACFVTPLMSGLRMVEMSPFDWVQRPALLFDAIEAHHGTLCWLPNFAFRVLVEDRVLKAAAERGRPWRLGGLRAFINCSEPVMEEAVAAFVDRLATHGVRAGQVIASYAMAEAIFCVTQNEIGAPRRAAVSRDALDRDGRATPRCADAADAVTLVSCGRALPTVTLEIRDAAGQILPEGRLGQIHIAGSHVFKGYRSDATAAAIDARGFYATGDLGFTLDGELYVTGRLKDLIIIRGRNYYPQDVEALVGTVDGVIAGRVVAFGVPDSVTGTEKLVILLESRPEEPTGKVVLAVRRQIAQSLDCTAGDVRIVPPRSLVKSTAGKISRAENRRRYLETAGTGQPGH
ncbi:AMP-binding protein [Reyranella sp.]|uniref:AMP-binding protein n=1 Tax=Reyranella sp. TaxID=1929291 RepID=UPI003BA90401